MSKKKVYVVLIIAFIIINGYLIISRTQTYKSLDLENYDRVKDTLAVGIVDSSEPYFYEASNGEYLGYNVDVLQYISKMLGFEFSLVVLEESEAIIKSNKNEIDLMLGKQSNFNDYESIVSSKPIIDNVARIFVRATDTDVNSIDDLSYKKVAIYKNDPSIYYISTLKNVYIYKTESLEDAAAMLRYGTVDVWIGNERESVLMVKSAEYLETITKENDVVLKSLKYSNAIKVVGESIEVSPYVFAVDNSQIDLLKQIDLAINLMEESGELRKLDKKWFGEVLGLNSDELKRFLYGTFIIIFSLSIIVFIIFRINTVLKAEIKRRTKRIEFQKNLIEGMLQSLTDSVITIDDNYKILFMNDKVLKLCDIDTYDEYIDMNIAKTKLTSIINIEHIKECIEKRKKVIGVENRIKISDNEKVIYEYNITPIKLSTLADRIITGATISIKDQTEQIMLKERIMKIDKLQSIEIMTAGVAHEIRNPLSTIDMYIKILPQKYDNLEFREQMSYDLKNEIERIKGIVDKLLNTSKVRKPNFELFNLSKEITGILRLIKMQTRDENIEFVERIDSSIMVQFDKNQFAQVCINVLTNAIEKLHEEGGGQVIIEGSINNGIVLLTFVDSGSEIPESDIESIFEPFYTTKDYGNGLGLSIVSELVSKNYGEIHAYNSKNRKPVFEISMKGEINDE